MTPLALVLTIIAIAQPAFAHFRLMSPLPRVYDDLLMLDAPCGGSNSTTVRYPFPIKGGTVNVQAYHSNGAMTFGISFINAPMTQADFATAWQSPRTLGPIGAYSFPNLDMSVLPGAKVGGNATLQLVFNGGDGMLYQCTDITFTASNSTASSSATGSFSEFALLPLLTSFMAFAFAI
ncbi:hypothetical protein BASA50_010349 [Batrachochytrium salamandrivorans]|uniref:Copper acquisition factor BIM1-like domain-containing protein n=1 Tax=Batrachochytrium salamandrivorans TaxID=1357716 RepID=A0ABQ8F1J6_9FUNG|nr:hypothetical protein BASA60_010641 [Batrachochytrium salamandrivorans]KAH6588993.1 hypothetical protein BASA50_010349 [Batrachochytrium salamandrivorans]KAH9267726.1 hypothetical protein BASA83_009800 [Batrachochytrium salamandrivorans]KAJ1336717.1 hypothetical protein BSLG_007036 [Batrachochytrium salamandrivorans]